MSVLLSGASPSSATFGDDMAETLGLVLRVFNELGIQLNAGPSASAPAPSKAKTAKRLTDIDSLVDE